MEVASMFRIQRKLVKHATLVFSHFGTALETFRSTLIAAIFLQCGRLRFLTIRGRWSRDQILEVIRIPPMSRNDALSRPNLTCFRASLSI